MNQVTHIKSFLFKHLPLQVFSKKEIEFKNASISFQYKD